MLCCGAARSLGDTKSTAAYWLVGEVKQFSSFARRISHHDHPQPSGRFQLFNLGQRWNASSGAGSREPEVAAPGIGSGPR